jgi:hypothetical protein
MKKLNKIFWWSLIVLWSMPELIYMFITKEPSKIANWLFNKLKLWD